MLPEENDDLQHDDNDELEQDYQEDVEDVEPDEQDSDSEPDSDADHEEKDGKANKQDSVEERIGELTRKRHEAERKAEERERELRELRRQVLTNNEPVVPELPDPDDVTDDEWKRLVQQRDAAIERRIEWQNQKSQFENEDQTQSRNEQLRRQQELQTKAMTYNQRAESLGVHRDELARAGNLISQVGIHDDVATEILGDESGPLITRYLANNVSDLLELSQMSPYQAARYIDNNIRPKLKPKGKRTKTTKPPKRDKGTSHHAKNKYPLTSGAKFE